MKTQHISQKKDPLAFVNEAQMSIHVSNQKKTNHLTWWRKKNFIWKDHNTKCLNLFHVGVLFADEENAKVEKGPQPSPSLALE